MCLQWVGGTESNRRMLVSKRVTIVESLPVTRSGLGVITESDEVRNGGKNRNFWDRGIAEMKSNAEYVSSG